MTPIRRRIAVVVAGVAAGLLAGGAAWGEAEAEIVCPVLDVPPSVFVDAFVGYAFPAEVSDPNGKDMGIADLGLAGEVGFWENDSGGDLTLRARWRTLMLEGYRESSSRYSLTRADLHLQWQQRFLGGFGTVLEAAPGIHSSLDGIKGGDLACPLGLTLILAPTPRLALLAGVAYYPGFDQDLEPRAGFRWRPGERFTLDLGYPETRLEAGNPEGMRFVLGGWWSPWPEFGMGDDPRERLLYDEGRAYAGFEWSLGGCVQLTLLGGYAFAREIEFENGGVPIEVEDAAYVQLGLAGLH